MTHLLRRYSSLALRDHSNSRTYYRRQTCGKEEQLRVVKRSQCLPTARVRRGCCHIKQLTQPTERSLSNDDCSALQKGFLLGSRERHDVFVWITSPCLLCLYDFSRIGNRHVMSIPEFSKTFSNIDPAIFQSRPS
ncbi:hypothetical protein J6590_050614 [Homalodisca vitripennis]|nr:hypothetical protein J6590_050614 [Homalodisca vitripennis]